MMLRIYSRSHPEGVLKDRAALTEMQLACIETTGVYRGFCQCCDKPIVARFAGERTAMTAGDEHFLLHGVSQ